MITVLYSVVAILSGVSYWFMHPTLIAQASSSWVIISNLTFNLILGACLLGAFSPKITRWIYPKAPRWTFVITAVILGVAFVKLIGLLGMDMKW